MNSLIKFLKISILTAILVLTAGRGFSQSDIEVVSFFVKEQLEVKDNQTVFNVFKVQNQTNRRNQVQVNFTIPVDWVMFGERTKFLDLEPGQEVSIPIRIAPSASAKGGVGYALNAAMITNDGETFASKYCFLTVPVKTDLDVKFSNINYYLDHRFGRVKTSLNIKNNGNANQLLGLRLFCDERVDFAEYGVNEFNTELSLEAGKDTTITTMLKYNDIIDNLNYFNKTLTAVVKNTNDKVTKYSFVRYLDYHYENYIEDGEHPLMLEVSMLDLLSESISFRILALGKLKFQNQKSLQYYYRSISAPLKELPNWKYDEYFVRYQTKKTQVEAGNIHDDYMLSMFGPGAKYKQKIGTNTSFELSAMDDIYSNQYALGGKLSSKAGPINYSTEYLKTISDTSNLSVMDMYGIGIRSGSRLLGSFSIHGVFNTYNQPEYSNKRGYSLDGSYYNQFGKYSAILQYRVASPYAPTYNRGRQEVNFTLNRYINNRSYLLANINRYKYQPSTIYNDLSKGMNYHYENIRLLYNYVLASRSTIYFGPNYDYGKSNYYENRFVDELKLQSVKAELGYRFSPNLYALKHLSLNMQVGQVKPLSYCHSMSTNYANTSNVLKFSATIQGQRWGVYGMYYSGLYNMSMALSNFYNGMAGKYLYFMPYFRITSADKKFYYEIRFSYLNNIDLKNTRTSIMQEGGADFGSGWSMRLQNNTNIQALQDATGQSYRYTSNYMELTVRKVFKWSQPGQKYHTIRTVFFRDLNGDRRKDDNEPGVENVIMSIANNSTIDTSYHFTGEMFGNVDLASNYNGMAIYENIPEAEYYLSFKPTDEQTEKFTLHETGAWVNLKKDTVLMIPFSERNIVFGTVRFNRSKRSSIQDLKLDNIKIAITDSDGHSYYGLTDNKGYYEIYAPTSDFYDVTIANNIWSDYFDLRHDKYKIKFNGYKRFEVNFEFDEKKREIKFDDAIDIDDIVSPDNFKFEDVTQIKQTILRGVVRDESTQSPLVATVEVIDLSRHDVVQKIKTSHTNGSFFTTFMTGNNYQLRISAPGYWIHQEALSSDQLTTFETINHENLFLKKITVGSMIETQNLKFSDNSPELSPEAKAELDNIVILLTNNEGVKINITGYADKNESQGLVLAMNRARKVSDFLTFRGISTNRINTEGKVSGNAANSHKVEITVSSNK